MFRDRTFVLRYYVVLDQTRHEYQMAVANYAKSTKLHGAVQEQHPIYLKIMLNYIGHYMVLNT